MTPPTPCQKCKAERDALRERLAAIENAARWGRITAEDGEHCVSPIARCWGGIFVGERIYSGDGYELVGAGEPCQPQCCAGHKWTRCGECGREGDRPGDECIAPCTPYTPETP